MQVLVLRTETSSLALSRSKIHEDETKKDRKRKKALEFLSECEHQKGRCEGDLLAQDGLEISCRA